MGKAVIKPILIMSICLFIMSAVLLPFEPKESVEFKIVLVSLIINGGIATTSCLLIKRGKDRN
jgi:hypothetical protein